jgi:hypothetical protein
LISGTGGAAEPGVAKWMPLSVRKVWILYGTAGMRWQEFAGDLGGGFLVQVDGREVGGAVDGDAEVELASSVRTSAMSMWK